MEPVLTTKNGRIFEIWELLERVCENPGGGHGPPLPPLADAHGSKVFCLKLLRLQLVLRFVAKITN